MVTNATESKKEVKKEPTLQEKVEQVNNILKENEPDNVSVDTFNNYIGYKPQSIIDAMNEGFGLDGWYAEELSNDATESIAVAHVRVGIKGMERTADAYGQSRITKGDIGDAKKGAQTDALKKALSYFSIGNRAYLGLLEAPKKEESAQVKAFNAMPDHYDNNGGMNSILCHIHNVEMTGKVGKYGRFYSHQNPDGTWCNGNPKGKPKTVAVQQEATPDFTPDGMPF